jgi:hypothetical protein
MEGKDKMEQKTATRCAKQLVREPGPWPRWHPCTRKSVVSEDGKKWCKQHAPSSVKARQKASEARFKADQTRRMAPYREAERLRAVNTKLLSTLERSANKLHDLRDEPECLRHVFSECPKSYCVEARAVIEEARK